MILCIGSLLSGAGRRAAKTDNRKICSVIYVARRRSRRNTRYARSGNSSKPCWGCRRRSANFMRERAGRRFRRTHCVVDARSSNWEAAHPPLELDRPFDEATLVLNNALKHFSTRAVTLATGVLDRRTAESSSRDRACRSGPVAAAPLDAKCASLPRMSRRHLSKER
jgi:hypothetical protein